MTLLASCSNRFKLEVVTGGQLVGYSMLSRLMSMAR